LTVVFGEAYRVSGVQVRPVTKDDGGRRRYCRPDDQRRLLASVECGRIQRRCEARLLVKGHSPAEMVQGRMLVGAQATQGSRHFLQSRKQHRLSFGRAA
jgi:hypothetical protein